VARGNQYTDDDLGLTGPSMSTAHQGILQRRNWHFPGNASSTVFGGVDYGPTIRNSVQAKTIINRALESNSPYRLGMAMHTYLDSFAHEGYEAFLGHASAGHDPDRPHLDPDKFLEATNMMTKILERWFLNNGKKLPFIPPDRATIRSTATYVPPSWQCSGLAPVSWNKDTREKCKYYKYDDEIEERVSNWKSKSFYNQKLWPAALPDYSPLSSANPDRLQWEWAARLTDVIDSNTSSKLLTMEWFSKDWSGENFGTAIKESLSGAKSQSVAAYNKDKSASILASGDKAAIAIDVLTNPDNYQSGYPQVLANANGVRELIKAAATVQNGWAQLVMLGGAPHSQWDWEPVWKYVKPFHNSKEFGTSLFVMSVASNVGAGDAKTCASINKFLRKYGVSKHSIEENRMLLGTLSPKVEFIASCASKTIDALLKLQNETVYQPLVASRLSLISSDEIYDQRLSKSMSKKIDNVRKRAFSSLKSMRSQVRLNSSRSVSITAQAAANTVGLWLALAEQDFDDSVSHSPVDIERLNDLEELLKAAVDQKDTETLSSICSAIATYDKDDLDDDTLVVFLKQLLDDPDFSSDIDEISYALENITSPHSN
jgi:hypothetical protein